MKDLHRKKRMPPNAGKGRPKGSLNKVTKTVKEGLEGALNADEGALEFWRKLKNDDPRTFAVICSKLIPLQIQQELNSQIDKNVTIKFESMERNNDA